MRITRYIRTLELDDGFLRILVRAEELDCARLVVK